MSSARFFSNLIANEYLWCWNSARGYWLCRWEVFGVRPQRWSGPLTAIRKYYILLFWYQKYSLIFKLISTWIEWRSLRSFFNRSLPIMWTRKRIRFPLHFWKVSYVKTVKIFILSTFFSHLPFSGIPFFFFFRFSFSSSFRRWCFDNQVPPCRLRCCHLSRSVNWIKKRERERAKFVHVFFTESNIFQSIWYQR